MEHKIKYSLIYKDYFSDPVSGEGTLTDEQIELLKKANDCKSQTYCYHIMLEDDTSFTTVYTDDDFLEIDEKKFNKWKKKNYGVCVCD